MKATYRFRVQRQGKRNTIEVKTPPRPRKPEPLVHPVARRLALAHYVERCVGDGVVSGYAAAARALGITRARMSQVMDLLMLPIETQEGILLGSLRPSKDDIRAALR